MTPAVGPQTGSGARLGPETATPVEAAIADARARSRAYGAFAQFFEYPDDARAAHIRSGALAADLVDALAALDVVGTTATDIEVLSEAGAPGTMAIEFTRLFEAGAGGASLHGSAYGAGGMKDMEEVMRFYRHFGLALAETPRELPDHLATELEFLHFLAFREAGTLAAGADAGPWQRAQRDFVVRHPGRWVPQLRRRVERRQPMRLHAVLLARLEALLAQAPARCGGVTGNPASPTSASV